MGTWKYIAAICLLAGCAHTKPDVLSEKRIETEASARDCATALSQAKAAAADNVSGIFVHGQRSLVDDRDYSERLDEYTSGVVKHYKVLENEGNSPCRVRIVAWVEPGKDRVQPLRGSTSVEMDDVNQRASQIRHNSRFLAQHLRDTKGFALEIGGVSTGESEVNRTTVTLDVTAITPPQRWLNDLEAYLRIHGEPVIYEKDSRGKALGRLLTLTRQGTEPPPFPSKFEICFMHQDGEEIRCYTGETNRKIIRVLRNPVIDIEVQTGRQRQHLDAQSPVQLTLYAHKELGVRYLAAGYVPRSDFPMITAMPLPTRFGFDYPASEFPFDTKVRAKLRFSGLTSEFPLGDKTP